MVIVKVCVGSSCYLRGSEEVVKLLQAYVAEHQLECELILMGSFCFGKCNRVGVTVQVDDDVFEGVTPAGIPAFIEKNIAPRLIAEG